MRRLLPYCLAIVAIGGDANAGELDDDFKTGLPKHWNVCQMYSPDRAALTPDDPDQAGDKITRIVVDKASIGGRKCAKPVPATEGIVAFDTLEAEEGLEPLGTSMVDPYEVKWQAKKSVRDPYCTNDVLKRGRKVEGCLQREEMRLATSETGDPSKLSYYSIKFRMPCKAPDVTHSIRWIIAQWKMEPTEYTDPSPYLALRYDDGILHVTVQNENCRCLVASAELPGNRHYAWPEEDAKYCVHTKPGPDEGKQCTTSGIKAYYGSTPHLKSPAGRWIEMQFQVQAGKKAQIIVRQDGNQIVRVEGDIGYPLKENDGDPTTKFKIGHYRDYIPSTDALEIDWIKVSEKKPWK